MIRPPQIDKRTASGIAIHLRALIRTYTPEWRGAGVTGDFGDALVHIFARYAEIVIERLNRAPEKNLLAYLDMLGESQRPPQPALVPLTFSLAAGSAADAVVPAGTQAAAPPAEGETTPVIFETERELTVVAASLDKVFVRDPRSNTFKDFSPSSPMAEDRRAFSAPKAEDGHEFRGTMPLDQSFYIGLDDLLARRDLRELRLDFVVDTGPSPLGPRQVGWSIVDGADGMEIRLADTTAGLTRSGQIRITFPSPPAVPSRSVYQLQSRWLRGRLATAITPGDRTATEQVRVTGLTVSADLSGQGLPVDRAFANTAPLDTTKDFLPFGERPRLGDVFYVSAGDAFGMEDGDVTLKFEASPPPPPASPPATPRSPPTLKWEYWDGERWAELAGLRDGTAALTKSGDLKFRLEAASPPATPPPPSPASPPATPPPPPASPSATPPPKRLVVNGAEGFWLRVRIAGGDYGRDARYIPNGSATGYKYEPPSLAPPSIAEITVTYELRVTNQKPDHVVTHNELNYARFEGADLRFTPFRPTEDTRPTLYLGFVLPDGRRDFPNRPVSLFLGLDEPLAGMRPDNPNATEPPRLVWECWTADNGWQRPGLRDGTRELTHSGVFEFLAPGKFARRREFGAARYWLRCRWEAGEFAFEPRLRQVALNTVMAEQASTILEETLGSSDASPGQRFVTARRPILHGQEELRVREPELPSADERARLEEASGKDAIAVSPDVSGRPGEIWVRWLEVPDFHGSTPRDRHYVLDHIAGTVGFGDGINGLIPPPGAGNLQLMRYRTGGGSTGNRDAHTIVQLMTTIPFIDRITNPEPARGGADAETIEALLDRAPRAIRHRYRAVTIEDYEDLALLASPEVARTKCVPLHDLSIDRKERFGAVSVVIVPRSTEAKPVPSLVLRERVAAYLDARRPAGAENLVVVGPDYVEIKIEAEVALTATDRASEVQPRVLEALRRFLHPLTGGFDGSGWDFGRRLHKSDLYRLIGEIPGVDHVSSIVVTPDPEQSGVPYETWTLVYARTIDITVTAAAPESAVT
jgi:hypothetical protein